MNNPNSRFSLPHIAASLILLAAMGCAPLLLSRFSVYLITGILVTGLLATSLNLVLGFGGMYQFHHAVFYGTGAYCTALLLTRTSLPAWAAFVSAPIAAALMGLVIGAICCRLSKLYFGMLQISLGSLVWAIVYRWYGLTGGDDGIHGIPLPALLSGGKSAYYAVLVVVALCLYLLYRIVQSPFGRIFQAIRDNPVRCEAVGIPVYRHQLVAQVLAAGFAGIAGALFVVLEGSVFPDMLFWTLSLEILIMCLLGGWFRFWGPMVGAAIVVSLRTYVGAYTEYWTLILGVFLMFIIFFLPDGVLGLIDRLAHRRSGAALS
ncbi:branched-chain amino acid ABC transporter permease [Desulfatirhabdium butyrativorans]|uniref:branched-chain amino acid ABC transporter permease n=1 Tax=Desulfatirhabdium butyrativorans TaxID=340467 RepID=UPI0003FF62AF|nr:branched-chain amino acid ABC transporter permease [Desulfatirhabdium butyrativorans]